MTSSGSESVACNESQLVNVGDPVHSSGVGVAANKCNSEKAAMVNRKSDQSYYP